MLPNDGVQSATRAVEVKPRDESAAQTGSALMTMPKTRMQQQWHDMRDKASALSLATFCTASKELLRGLWLILWLSCPVRHILSTKVAHIAKSWMQ